MSGSQLRDWCFTYNNYTPEGVEELKNYPCRYMVFGYEVGESGTPHLQGYVEFKSPKKLKTLKNQLPETIHWESRRGSAKQASGYCKKQATEIFEKGEMTKQGSRTDLAGVKTMIDEGASLNEIAIDRPAEWIKFNRGITDLYIRMRLPPRKPDVPPVVTWIWGGTGVGKTRFVYELHEDSIYMKDGTRWWNGYEGQEAILVDDYDGQWPYTNLLRFLDRYPYQGETKGGYVNIHSPYIYITCEFHPNKFYYGTALDQVVRRINYIFHFE